MQSTANYVLTRDIFLLAIPTRRLRELKSEFVESPPIKISSQQALAGVELRKVIRILLFLQYLCIFLFRDKISKAQIRAYNTVAFLKTLGCDHQFHSYSFFYSRYFNSLLFEGVKYQDTV